eukprot:TRINITY_DN2742_c1_g1_i1.p1 TRINITY_DN2742_c1_g1~~TRINITY_DN2742_c1_g1_i1.p1  ORF type:complete len:304 (+),score=55.53 TRINITY_DN2742_c1_g1_i1:963-1874(+)
MVAVSSNHRKERKKEKGGFWEGIKPLDEMLFIPALVSPATTKGDMSVVKDSYVSSDVWSSPCYGQLTNDSRGFSGGSGQHRMAPERGQGGQSGYSERDGQHGKGKGGKYAPAPQGSKGAKDQNMYSRFSHGPGNHPSVNAWLARPTEKPEAKSEVSATSSLETGVKELMKGQWFLKWRKEEHPHRRFIWLDRKRWQLYWSKSNDINHFVSDWIHLQDTIRIETETILQNVPGITHAVRFHVIVITTLNGSICIVITTLNGSICIATSDAEHFQMWRDTLLKLTSKYRRERAQRLAANGLTPCI